MRVVLVPSYAHAGLLRQALATALAEASIQVIRLPRIVTPVDWLQSLMQSLNAARLREDDLADLTRRVELFEALRQTEWLATALGRQTGGMWPLSRQLLSLSDELSWAVWLRWADEVDQVKPDQIESRLRALIKSSYGAVAWSACSPEAELVLGLWRASASNAEAPNSILIAVRAVAQRSTPNQSRTHVLAVAPELFAPHEQALLASYARHAVVDHIVIDVARSLPLALKLAWPECLLSDKNMETAPDEDSIIDDLRSRAAQFRVNDAPLSLELIATHSLEDEAVAAASRVLNWLDEGQTSIGLVALDRVVARRVRALLERAEVLVQDETGWKLSTSSAAGMLMRWLQLAGSGDICETSVLLDWLKSPFVWRDLEIKPAVLARIETAVRRNNVARGWASVFDALVHADEQTAQTRKLLELVRQQAQAPRGRQTLARYFAWLEESLASSAMRPALQSDPVGANLLALLDTLARSVQQQPGRYSFGEWRDLVADALENTLFRDDKIKSPVVLCSLQGARLRCFDAVMIVGADAKNFSVTSTDALFLTPGLRAELGLSHRDAETHQQLLDLALLLSSTQTAVISWQAQRQGESNPLAPPLERLSLLHRLAYQDDLRRSFVWPTVTAREQMLPMPAPSAAALVPLQLSASSYERLISCPYRFYVYAMLGLMPLDEVSEDAEKRDYGELLHRILQRFHDGLKQADIDPATLQREQLIASLEEISRAVFAPLLAANGDFIAWRERWLALLPAYVDWLLDWCNESEGKGWTFQAAEFGGKAELQLDDQHVLKLHGRIDRIDRGQSDEQATLPIAIIDYKARSKTALAEKLKQAGEDVQLPFYRLLMPDANVVDALYLTVDQKRVEAVRAAQPLEALSGALALRIQHDFSRLMKGAALPANGADATCQYCDARGLCRKGHWRDE